MPNLKVLYPTLNDPSAAGSNVTKINSLLAAGGECHLIGSGICWVNAPLVIGSNTGLVVDDTLEIKQVASASASNLLQSACYSRAWRSCTLGWSAGLQCLVTLSNHGLSNGEPFWLRGVSGTTDPAFFGLFDVTNVVDAGHFYIELKTLPSAAPTGTIQGKVADVNISVTGGFWNYNTSGGAVPAVDGLDGMAILLVGVKGLFVDVMAKDSYEYLLCTGGIREFNLALDTTKNIKDGVKVFGPAWNGKVSRVSGWFGDDACSAQCIVPPAFSFVDATGGGNILDIELGGIDTFQNAAQPCALYPSNWFAMDNVTVDRVASGIGTSANTPLVKIMGEVSGCIAGRIDLKNIRSADNGTSANGSVQVYGSLTVKELVIDGLSWGDVGPTNTQQGALEIEASSTVKVLRFQNFKGRIGGNNTGLIQNYGTIGTIIMDGFNVVGAGGSVLYYAAPGSVNNRVILQNSLLNGVENPLLAINASGELNFVYQNNGGTPVAGVVVAGSNPCSIAVGNNKHTGLANSLVRLNGASLAASIHDMGGNSVPSGKWLAKVNGAETVSVFGFEFQADVTALARTNGSFCFNTNAAAGTLGAAGLVACQGTSPNSWRLLGDPTKQY